MNEKIYAIPLTPVDTDVVHVYCAFCGMVLSRVQVLFTGTKDNSGDEMWKCKCHDCNRAGWGK